MMNITSKLPSAKGNTVRSVAQLVKARDFEPGDPGSIPGAGATDFHRFVSLSKVLKLDCFCR